jgi:hypothetical protein
VPFTSAANIESPRLIGHGGVPVWVSRDPKPPGVEFEYNAFVESGLERFLKFGFAVLDFDGDKIGEQHIGEDGHQCSRDQGGDATTKHTGH